MLFYTLGVECLLLLAKIVVKLRIKFTPITKLLKTCSVILLILAIGIE